MAHRDGLSKRQKTMQTLYPQRHRDGAQLALGYGAHGHQHIARCPYCNGLMQGRKCVACLTFVCTQCQAWTSGNGGNGNSCYACLCKVGMSHV